VKVICIINLKGGVAKTISAINIAHVLNKKHSKRVLLIDNDKQGNTSKFYGKHGYDGNTLADVLMEGHFTNVVERISPPKMPALDLVPANMDLLHVDRHILIDASRPQQTRLKKAIASAGFEHLYDFAVIDCAPDLNMSVINAIVAADHVLIPIKVDKFAFDGIDTLLEQIEEMQDFNPDLRVLGGFVTMYSKNNVNLQGMDVLSKKAGLPMFKTAIRNTIKVSETTYTGLPLAEYAPKSTAARDYGALVDEYLQKAGVRL